MAKLSNPFHSLRAHGSIGRILTVRRRNQEHIAQVYPTHPDANTTAQQGQRLMFTMCKDLWHTLSQGEQRAWEALARPFHMSGYSYYLSQCLRPNPGIYLPLAGGTMAGVIDMDGNRITTLPAPGASADPARLAELTAHSADETGPHNLEGFQSFSATKTSNQSIPRITYTKVTWQTEHWDTGGHMDLANNRVKPTKAGYWVLWWSWRLNNMNNGQLVYTRLYKNGGSYRMLNNPEAHDFENKMENAWVIVYLNGTTDYAEWYIYHTAPTSLYLQGTSLYTWCQGFLIPQST